MPVLTAPMSTTHRPNDHVAGSRAAGDLPMKPRRRPPRRKGRAVKDAERRALAKANARPTRPVDPAPPGFAVLHADGGARGAPGPAAIGYVIDDEAGVRLAEHAGAIGVTSAAVAEYRALLAGLQRAHELGLICVAARSDSRLLIGHVTGDRHIRHPQLLALEAEIVDVRTRIGTVVFSWIPVDSNGVAHQLVAAVLGAGAGGGPARARNPHGGEYGSPRS
jgi:ribonuclease HI